MGVLGEGSGVWGPPCLPQHYSVCSRARSFCRMRVRLVFRRSRVRSSGPAKHYFVDIGDEMISTAILPLPLIQIGELSVTGERMCIKYDRRDCLKIVLYMKRFILNCIGTGYAIT